MMYRFETVFISLYDVGRSVDLAKTGKIIPASQDRRTITTRDTPASISVPAPLFLELYRRKFSGGEPFEEVSLTAKIYEDGVVSMIARAIVSMEFERIHTIRGMEFLPEGDQALRGEKTTLGRWMHRHFEMLRERIMPAITAGAYLLEPTQQESYAAFCLVDTVEDPDRFVDENAQYLSTFLLGENPSMRLHVSQVKSTLGHRFSFKHNELVLLDLDRCLIIDPDRDYEDILLILELANYQLLELRTLDKLLDQWLDQAEDDIHRVYLRRSHRTGILARKLGGLLPLRLDALFVLENLENTSKIIGDYYLGQLYEHLCSIIGTRGWEISVRRRLDMLQSIYSMAKGDVNERLLLIMEIVVVLLIAFEIITLFFPLLPHK